MLSEENDPETNELKIYFNPFLFSIEQNNAFLAAGYEVMPITVPVV